MKDIDTKEVTALCKKLDEVKSSLREAITRREILDFGGHQDNVVACIGKTQISVSELSRRTGYASTVIRGREMIVLGMQRVANADIEYWQNQVDEISKQIAKVVRSS